MNTMPKLSIRKRMPREYNNNRSKKARTVSYRLASKQKISPKLAIVTTTQEIRFKLAIAIRVSSLMSRTSR